MAIVTPFVRVGTYPTRNFCYLRTVIVTAAVYWDFSQELAPHHLIFQHWAGVTPYTSTFVFAECCVFNKQSQPPFHCNPFELHPQGTSPYRAHLLPKLRCQFAEFLLLSSLKRLLGFSPYPPVSVCSTVNLELKLRGLFLEAWDQSLQCTWHSSSRLSSALRICL